MGFGVFVWLVLGGFSWDLWCGVLFCCFVMICIVWSCRVSGFGFLCVLFVFLGFGVGGGCCLWLLVCCLALVDGVCVLVSVVGLFYGLRGGCVLVWCLFGVVGWVVYFWFSGCGCFCGVCEWFVAWF